MEVDMTKSKKSRIKNMMPELMALKLLFLVRRWHRTTPNINIHIENKDT